MYVPISDSVQSLLEFCEEPIQLVDWEDPEYYHQKLHQLVQDSIGSLEWLFFSGNSLQYIKRCLLVFSSRETPEGGWSRLDETSKCQLGPLYRAHEQIKELPIWGTPQMIRKISEARASIVVKMIWEILARKHWMLTTIYQDRFEGWFKERGVLASVVAE